MLLHEFDPKINLERISYVTECEDGFVQGNIGSADDGQFDYFITKNNVSADVIDAFCTADGSTEHSGNSQFRIRPGAFGHPYQLEQFSFRAKGASSLTVVVRRESGRGNVESKVLSYLK